jgi:hypothetical protein
VVADAVALPTPIPYRHPSGAVIWVSFRAGDRAIGGANAEPSRPSCPRTPAQKHS